MSAIFNSLNAHNLLIFQPILMILVSKFMVYRALSDKIYLSLGLLSPLMSVFPFKNYVKKTESTNQKRISLFQHFKIHDRTYTLLHNITHS